MSSAEETLELDLKSAVQQFARQHGNRQAAVIEPILLTNLARGRVRYFLDRQANSDLNDYICRVADYYGRWHDYVYKIQHEQQPELWEPLYKKLQQWAFGLLRKKGFLVEEIRRQRYHVICATETSVLLLHAHFPYDTDFDPWAFVVVENVVHKQAERLWREHQKEQNTIPVDQWEAWQENLSDHSAPSLDELVERRSELLSAIEQLPSAAQQALILQRYFEDHSFQQIAADLGKTVNAIYRLHFEALANLRKILSSEGDK